MRPSYIFLASLALLVLIAALASPAAANLPSVDVSAPGTVKAGKTVNVDVRVDHKDSMPSHYVDSIRLYDGEKLVKEWKYDRSGYVPQETWTVTIPVKVDKSTNLNAIAHCILHGDGTGTRAIVAT